MQGNRRFSLIDRLTGRSRSASFRQDDVPVERTAVVKRGQEAPAQTGLKGAELEQAYRDLMLENQMLVESNEHLHERLARIASETLVSAAAQRNALAERSHRLREVQYENLNLKREQKKLVKENQRLAASLARHMHDIQPLLSQEQLSQRELEEAKAALRKKSDQLATLTDKYYQLEARSKPQPPPSSAANGRF